MPYHLTTSQKISVDSPHTTQTLAVYLPGALQRRGRHWQPSEMGSDLSKQPDLAVYRTVGAKHVVCAFCSLRLSCCFFIVMMIFGKVEVTCGLFWTFRAHRFAYIAPIAE